MAKRKDNQRRERDMHQSAGQQRQNIGNQQGTSQTGGQNSGGRNRMDEEDEFSRDLKRSGNRKSRE